MKRFVKVLCMMAVVALAFTSCKKTESDNQSFPFKGSLEQFRTINDSFDGLDRVYMDDNLTVHFEVGDRVMIFNIYMQPSTEIGTYPSSCLKYTVNENGLLVQSEGTLAQVINQGTLESHYYCFYPGDNVVDFSQLYNENRCTFRLDPVQNYRTVDNQVQIPQGALYMAAKDEEHNVLTEAIYNMRNICGVLSLKFFSPSGKTVSSIVVEDKHFNLVGDVTLKIHEVDPIYLTELFLNYDETDPSYMQQLASYLGPDYLGWEVGGDKRNYVTLNCGEGVQLGTEATDATRFLIVLRPLALYHGCTVTVNFTEGEPFEIDTERNLIISPNVIRNMAPVNVG
jgi:hypothetical protein